MPSVLVSLSVPRSIFEENLISRVACVGDFLDAFNGLSYVLWSPWPLEKAAFFRVAPMVTPHSSGDVLKVSWASSEDPHVYRVRLHSHDVKYGSGSGQQSVTGSPTQEDHNSNWLIKGTPNKPCSRGEPVKCGEEVRLEHVSTHRNLHSHHFSSPLSSQQEVSAFGEDGEGDTGDVWSVVCDGDLWRRDDKVMLRHTDTDVYLGVTGQQYGRPINGQSEVVGVTKAGPQAKWQTMEGVFVQRSELPVSSTPHAHSEL